MINHGLTFVTSTEVKVVIDRIADIFEVRGLAAIAADHGGHELWLQQIAVGVLARRALDSLKGHEVDQFTRAVDQIYRALYPEKS
jgi:hypothetical protein